MATDATDVYDKAKADVEQLRERQAHVAAKLAKYEQEQRQIGPALHEAILRLNEAQCQVDQVNAADLKSELEQVLTSLESAWTSAGEKRVFEIFAALRIARWCNHPHQSLAVYVEHLKNPGPSRVRRSWRGLMAWVHEPESAAA